MSSVPTVQLTGDALSGVHIDGDTHRRAVAALPQAVRLGRVRSKTRRNVVHLADFVDLAAAEPPARVDYYTKAAASLTRMYLNDQYGCCVVSGKAHSFGVWSGNDSDSGGVVTGSDQEILSQYRKWCGHLGNDSGCIIDEVLTRILNEGMVLNGKTHRIDGFASVDHTNKKLVQVALLLTGSATIGINLPSAWANSDVWDVTNSRIVGGHDVSVVGYDERGVYVSSWGRVYLMTWAAFLSTRWVEEMYVVLSDVWYGPDKMSPAGLDVAGLKAALDRFKSGGIPDWEPTPVIPPAPPAPVPPPAPRTFSGTATLTGRVPLLGSMTMTGPVVLTEGNPASAALAPAGLGLPAWLVPLLLKYGEVVVPIVYRGLLAGKPWPQILQEVLAAVLAAGPHPAAAAIDPARVNVLGLTVHLLQLAAHVRAGNYEAVVADLLAIAADLGIDLKGLN